MAKGKYGPWIEEEGLLKLTAYARSGMTDADIAEKIGIVPSTLYAWMEKFPDISEAIKKGKEPVDTDVENHLLKRALGYYYDEETRELCKDPNTGEMVLQVTKSVRKHVLPDTTAQIFWLKNRKPKVWRDKPSQDSTDGPPVVHVVFDEDEEDC